jgi:hypothetical protein
VPRHADARIAREDALDARGRRNGAVGDRDLAAWIDLPMPTPPPWWIDTQLAPAATLSIAFSNGQSAIASLPSRIASVSRYGEATEPQSRWSRPEHDRRRDSPFATSSLTARPKRARSP